MTQENEQANLLDMLYSARWLATYTSAISLGQFLSTRAHQNAVLFEIIRFSEAAGRLSEEFRSSCSDIPWMKIRGFRNRIIHEYDRIDFEIAWAAATHEIPMIVQKINSIIQNRFPELDHDA